MVRALVELLVDGPLRGAVVEELMGYASRSRRRSISKPEAATSKRPAGSGTAVAVT